MEIILASGSPRRKELLSLICPDFKVIVSGCSETVTQTVPGKIVEELSRQKAEDVSRQVEAGIVIGSDTIVFLPEGDDEEKGKVLGKPADREDAFHMIRSLAGRSHLVFTGVTLIQAEDPKKTETFHCATRVYVHDMSDAEIEHYLDSGEAFDKAGSYGIQGAFAAYVDKIEGSYQNVVGLPVAQLYRALCKFTEEAK